MLYAILGLLFVAMIVLAVLSAKKDWHWLNPVLLVFIFLAGSAGMVGMAQTLHLQRLVLKKLDDATKRVERAEQQRQEVLYGDIAAAEYSPTSLRGITQTVELMYLGRGREWSGGKPTANNGTITYTFASDQELPADDNMRLQTVELFAFADRILTINVPGETEPQNVVTPVQFVGKFRVTEQTPQQLILIPSVPIVDFEEYRNPQAVSWTLFERMPFDQSGIFREVAGIKEGEEYDIAQYRNFLTTTALPAARMGLDPASAEYERLIDEYAFDGLSKGKIDAWVDAAPNRVSPRFEPNAGELFYRYRFTDSSKESYTVDDKTGKLDTDGTFSIQGHAVDPLLHLSPGEESRDVTFKKDDIVELDQLTADGYQLPDGTAVQPFEQREPVELIDTIFRRRLVDFPYEMTKLYNRMFQIENDTARKASNNQVTDGALEDRNEQIQQRQRDIAAFENDNRRLQKDLVRISSYLIEREQLVSDNEDQIERLKSSMQAVRQAIELQSQSIGATSR